MRRLTRWVLWAGQLALLYLLGQWFSPQSGLYEVAILPAIGAAAAAAAPIIGKGLLMGGGAALGSGLLGGLFGGGGGGGGGVQGASVLNPASPLVMQLLGTKLGIGRTGVRYRNDPKVSGIFGPDNEYLIDAVQKLAFDPAPLTPLQQEALAVAEQEGLGRLPQSLDLLDQVQIAADELARTGIRTDASELFDIAMNRFNRDVLPAVAEMQGLPGIQSSGFQEIAAREGSRLMEEAAIKNIDLLEAANLRRAQAGPSVAGLSAANVALPINMANDLRQLGEFTRMLPFEQPGRAWNVFQQLTGMGSPSSLGATQNIGGFPTTNNFANTLGGLGSLIGGIGSFGSLFKGGLPKI